MNADPKAIARYLHQHIPLTAHMQVGVCAVDATGVRLGAPLAPNINHRQTAFGGSAAALATLSCWTLIHLYLAEQPFASGLVVRRSQMDYETPIDADFEAFCPTPAADIWARFTRSLDQHGKDRIELAADVLCCKTRAARFSGEFVALRQDG